MFEVGIANNTKGNVKFNSVEACSNAVCVC